MSRKGSNPPPDGAVKPPAPPGPPRPFTNHYNERPPRASRPNPPTRPTVYRRIMTAAAGGHGLTLTPDEVSELSADVDRLERSSKAPAEIPPDRDGWYRLPLAPAATAGEFVRVEPSCKSERGMAPWCVYPNCDCDVER